MTYMCNKCMGHLLNFRSPGGGALGGKNSLSYILYFFLIL